MASQTGSQKHRQVHHLSREAGDPNGWVESITGLTADQPATDLLNNGSASKHKPTAPVSRTITSVGVYYSVCSIVISLSVMYAQACLDLMQANGSTAEAAGATGLQSFSGLSLQEENDMRLEHALEILKADVSFALGSCESQLQRELLIALGQ
jgi:hypothetical protein